MASQKGCVRFLSDIWDHRNASLREWLVKEHVMGASSGGMDGMANPNVTGFCERRDA
jgi:hypothetical protein